MRSVVVILAMLRHGFVPLTALPLFDARSRSRLNGSLDGHGSGQSDQKERGEELHCGCIGVLSLLCWKGKTDWQARKEDDPDHHIYNTDRQRRWGPDESEL